MAMIIKAVAAGVVSGSFAVLFQIRGRKALYAGLCGAVGYLLYLLVAPANAYVALFLSSMAMALYAEIMARLLKTPATSFITAGLIPIVPGGGMFSFVLKAMEGELSQAATLAVDTLLQAGAIAGGIIFLYALSRMVFRLIDKKRRLNTPHK